MTRVTGSFVAAYMPSAVETTPSIPFALYWQKSGRSVPDFQKCVRIADRHAVSDKHGAVVRNQMLKVPVDISFKGKILSFKIS